MKLASDLPAPILALAKGRHGVVLSRELESEGVVDHLRHTRIHQHVLEKSHVGVLVVAAFADQFTPLAALQAARDLVVAERRTAAAVFDFDGFREQVDPLLDLVVPPGYRIRLRDAPKVRRAWIPRQAMTVHHALLVTTPTWTLGELGCCSGVDADLLELGLESALRRDLTTEGKLHAVVDQRPSPDWPGTTLLAEVLGRRRPGAPPTGSYAETRFLQTIVRPARLPDPDRQVPIFVPGRRHPYLADFLFRCSPRDLIVEIDGLSNHFTPAARAHDLIRDEELEALGYRIKRIAAGRVEVDSRRVQHMLTKELRN